MGKFIPNPLVGAAIVVDPEFQARMELIGQEALSFARDHAPVATGNLRDSLKVERLSNGGRRVSTDVDYWLFPEFGTVNMPAEPYLRPTLTALGLRVT